MTSETREIVHDLHEHPVHSTRLYWVIGGILTVLTAIEIAAYYLEHLLGAAAAPFILVLSAAKFVLVGMFFMHLKYDSKVFSGFFVFPMALAALVIVSLILLYHLLHPLR
jgi:cytochrome c oxidase subunit IV